MRAIIIANGRECAGADWVRAGDWIVAADGGAARALAWGLTPHLVIGDMDSLPGDIRSDLEKQGCRFILHPRDKDETDLELALRHVARAGATEIIILGAMGGRTDHAFANVLLLTLPFLAGVAVRIVSEGEEISLVRGGESLQLTGQRGDLVSLLPLGGDAHGVMTEGLAWALEDETLFFGRSRGVSNEMTAPQARIGVEEGFLLVIHRKTAAGDESPGQPAISKKADRSPAHRQG